MSLQKPISAADARAMAVSINGRAAADLIARADEAIRSAASRGRCRAEVEYKDLEAEKPAVDDLKARGYKVERFSDQREGSYYIITW